MTAAGMRAGIAVVGLALLVALAAACGGGGPAPSGTPAASASLAPSASGSPAVVASPVSGALIKLDSEGLVRVNGFRLRTDEGEEMDFRIGTLDNGVEFPPGHLTEHMSTSTRVRVFFRDEAGEHVVYRLEDAE